MRTDLDDHLYLAVKREFILKVDGNRPILYPLDYINTKIYFLAPLEGFALSLLDGRKPVREVRQMFQRLFPEQDKGTLAELLSAVDRRVRESPSQTGIGADGLFEISDRPSQVAQIFDPRVFVISPAAYQSRFEDPRRALRLDTPINIYTVFTHRCVANCLYCYADRRACVEMPLAEWRRIIHEMRDLDIRMASPDNGDTLARKDGIALLECLLEYDMHFLLSTKAYVSRENVQRLLAAGFTRKIRGVIERKVQLSVDAADPDISRLILHVPRSHTELSLRTLENFLACGIMPKIKAVMTGLNYNQPKPIVDLFYPRGARVFHFVRYHRTFHRHTDALFVNPEHLPVLARQFQEIRETYPDVDLVENLTADPGTSGEPSPERARSLWDTRIGCGGGWSALGIAPDGKAFLCEQMKMEEPFYVGDARTQSIPEIWHGERLLRFIHPSRQQFGETVCKTCPEFEECVWTKGRCYRDAYFAYGSIFEPPPLCPRHSHPGLRLS